MFKAIERVAENAGNNFQRYWVSQPARFSDKALTMLSLISIFLAAVGFYSGRNHTAVVLD